MRDLGITPKHPHANDQFMDKTHGGIYTCQQTKLPVVDTNASPGCIARQATEPAIADAGFALPFEHGLGLQNVTRPLLSSPSLTPPLRSPLN
jgi:hypothetical protein